MPGKVWYEIIYPFQNVNVPPMIMDVFVYVNKRGPGDLVTLGDTIKVSEVKVLIQLPGGFWPRHLKD